MSIAKQIAKNKKLLNMTAVFDVWSEDSACVVEHRVLTLIVFSLIPESIMENIELKICEATGLKPMDHDFGEPPSERLFSNYHTASYSGKKLYKYQLISINNKGGK